MAPLPSTAAAAVDAHLLEALVREQVVEAAAARIVREAEVLAHGPVHGADHAVGVERDRARVELVDHRFEEAVGPLQIADQPLVLDRELVVLDRALHHLLQVIGLPRLADVGVDVPVVDRLDDRVHVREAGQDHPDRAGMAPLHLGDELDATHVGHALVGEHHRERSLRIEQIERAARVGRGLDVVVVLEREAHRLEDGFLVIDDQDSGSGGFHRD